MELSLNRGRLAEIFLRCLEKKPLFRVEKEGYPFTRSLLAFAAIQEALGPWSPSRPPFEYAWPLEESSP